MALWDICNLTVISYTLEDLNSELDAAGENISAGIDSWDVIGLIVTLGAAITLYDSQDAEQIFNRVITAANFSPSDERLSEKFRIKTIFELRQFLMVGAKFGTDTIERAAELYKESHFVTGIPNAIYAALLNVCMFQLATDVLLEDEEIEYAFRSRIN